MSRQILTLPDVPSTLLTQATADPLFLTQAEGDARYLQPATAASTYLPLAGGTLTGNLLVNATNTLDLGATATRWRKLWVTDVDINTGLTFAADATAKLSRPSAGALRVDTTLGVGVNPAAWDAGQSAVQLGAVGAVSGGAAFVALRQNSYVNGGVNKALVTGPGVSLSIDTGTTYLYTAPSVAAGATQTFTQRMSVNQQGTLTLSPDAGQNALNASGGGVAVTNAAVSVSGGGGGIVVYDRTQGTQYTILSRDNNVFSILQSGFGNRATWNNTGTLTLTPDAGQPTLVGPSGAVDMTIRSPASNIILDPFNGYVMPPTDNTKTLGFSSLRWTLLWAVNGTIQTSTVEAKTDITPLDPAACAQAVLDTDWVSFTYLPPTFLAPEPTAETAYDEHDSNEVKAEKKAKRDEQEEAARQAHAKMLVETQPARDQKGYVLGSPDHRVSDLFGLSDRKSATPQSDLGVVACALQDALKRIAALETHLGVQA